MSFDPNDDILQDFLVEAGELLEHLNEQLVELEQRPQDAQLLNAVFRSFHTVKGGASFLNLTHLVEVCHRAEDVFNVLRNGERVIDAGLMDAVLRVVDIVNSMFAEIHSGKEPSPSDPALLEELRGYTTPAGAAPAAPTVSAQPTAPAPAASSDDVTDAEFEQMLADAQAKKAAPASVPASIQDAPAAKVGGDEISDDEFEALLDQLHGGGAPKPAAVAAPPVTPPPAAPAASGGDTISDDEFEALLDQIQSKGKTETAKPAVAAAPVAKPVPKPEPKAAAPAAAPDAQAHAPAADTTVRVDTKRLDDIMNLVGELVLVRNRLATLKASMGDGDVAKAVANLDVVTADLQMAVMKTRMQPIKKVFGRFPRVVRDLARALNKEVNLEMQGEETDLDKNLVEALADPLVHLVRNAVDHGIEGPDEREKAGKPRVGTVILAAEQEGDHILLSIEDDGKGMDPEVLRRKAVEKGIMDEESAARLDEKDCYNLIFHAGFSTKTEISDISGRGVGMDVVKTRIAQLNGSVDIDSRKGRGSRLSIRVPLTLAIMPTLMVVLGNQPFALPLASVSEIFDLDHDRTNVVDGQLTVMVRNKALPLFYLRKWLVRDSYSENKGGGHVVMVQVANQKVGFVVDQLIGQEEVVIKPLGAMLQGMPGFAGATITGNGRIALILDVPSLMKKYARRM
ncbi:MAG: chemotaxis protein CheA [Gammaproteobacteria bacterium]|nr:chemotaxis protein CheA [Gammaproteobacteria bacterium]